MDRKVQSLSKREEEVAAKSRNNQVTILQRHWSPAETFQRNLKRTENRRTCCCRFRWRNDENRPGLNSCTVAEEGQDVSSKNTIDELSDAITGGKDIGLWSSNIPEKMREYWSKNEKSFVKHDVPQHRNDRNSSRKCTTNLIRRQNHNAEVVERSRLCCSSSQTCIYCFTCWLTCADTTRCAYFLIRKGICDWKHAEEPRAISGT